MPMATSPSASKYAIHIPESPTLDPDDFWGEELCAVVELSAEELRVAEQLLSKLKFTWGGFEKTVPDAGVVVEPYENWAKYQIWYGHDQDCIPEPAEEEG